MAYRFPSIDDFKAQFVRDFPYATPASAPGKTRATGTTVILGGGVTSITVVSGGAGYTPTQPPGVVLYGGKGLGARATATVTGTAVSAFTIIDPGFGYIEAPTVYVTIGGDNTDLKKVTDFDIAKALTLATAFNSSMSLFGSQAAYTTAMCLLAAHYLCTSVNAGQVGLNGQANWITAAKTVDGVTESFQIPKRILNSPYLSKLSRTVYGAQYLELVSPLLIGNIQSFRGVTQP